MISYLNNTETGRALQSYLKTFLATILALFLVSGADVFSVDTNDLKIWLAAGIASVLPVIIGALNPKDSRYGRVEDEESYGLDDVYEDEEENEDL